MRLRLDSFLLTSALTFAPAVASATTISGLYVDGGAGYNLVQDQHVHANSPYANSPAVQKFSVNHGTGFTGFGAVGWGFGNGLRVEAEGLYNFSHDDYTDNQMSLQDYYKLKGVNFYTNVPGATPVNCTSGSNPFYSNGNSAGIWGTGDPATNGLNTTTTPSNSWQYTPADKCFVISNPAEWNAYHKWASDWNIQAPFNYIPPGWTGKEGINPEPGTYANSTGVNIYGTHSISNANVFKPIPLYTNHQGTDESYGGFFNVLYDFDLERLFGVKSIVTPFIGG
ncbi:MAG: hypothetical protein J6P38_02800, partial [Acetobacter sp.]|nr:hypothetical protein [Acetobacter sp.]